MALRSPSLTSLDPRTVGAFITIFSLGMALLLFVLPVVSYLFAIQLMICALGFAAGIATMIVGQMRVWRRKDRSG